MKHRFLSSTFLAVAVSATASMAHAQTPAAPLEGEAAQDDAGIEDIVVTAQKRSESLQRVPISVSVATNETLKASGAIGIQSLKVAAPNVDVNNNIGFVLPFIRGVGSKASGAGLESPVSIYVDGVYYAATTSTLLSFSNIEQIEVLKGPQGTLFGRNATGGVIHVKMRDPSSTPGGDIDIGVGNYGTLAVNAYVTGGNDTIAADLTLHAMTMAEGYGRNLLNGADVGQVQHDIGVRSKWKFQLGDTTTARVGLDYTNHLGSDNVQRYPANFPFPAGFGPSYGGRPWDTDVNILPKVETESYGASLTVDQEIGTLALTSITAYRKSDFSSSIDIDYSRSNVRFGTIAQKDRQFSQEVQIQSTGSGPVDWTLGAFYFNARSLNPPIRLVFASATAGPSGVEVATGLDINSIAGFGQATWRVTDRLSLTGGLRYTSEKRSRDGEVRTFFVNGTVSRAPADAERRFNKLTWRAAADYRFADRVLGYVSYNRGFKSGGFNSSALTVPAFLPEVLDAYEVGLKSDLSRTLRVNLSGFYYNYRDIQVQRYIGGVNGVYNGAKAEFYGGEIEVIAQPTPEWKLSADYQYLHGKFKEFTNAVVARPLATGGVSLSEGDVSGNRTPISPRSTLSLNSVYTIPLTSGSLALSANAYYNSGFFHEPDNLLKQDDYILLNASIRWEVNESGLAVVVWGNNLTNRAVAASGAVQAYGTFGLPRYAYEPPRTYGVRLEAKF